MPKLRVYLDTSVLSALYDDRTPERLALTKAAWENLKAYDIYVSELVVDELNAAPSWLRERFQKVISELSVLKVTDDAESLAEEYVKQGIFPVKYYDDALHVAIASVNDISYLLSWNFKHLVKVKTRKLVSLVNAVEDYAPVEIIAPPEL